MGVQVQGWYGRGANGPDIHFQGRRPPAGPGAGVWHGGSLCWHCWDSVATQWALAAGASAAWAGLQRDWEGVSRCKQLWLLWVPCSTRLGWIKGGCGPDSHQRKNGFNYLGGSSNGLFQEGLLSQYFHPDPFCPAFAPTDQLATPSPTPPIPKRLDWKVLSASPNPRHPWSLILP